MLTMRMAWIVIGISTLLLGSCQQQVFGVDQTVWTILSEKERQQVIEGYNRRKELALLQEEKKRDQELENDGLQFELSAESGSIYGEPDSMSFRWGSGSRKPEFNDTIRVQSISSKMGRQILTIGGEQFEISTFTRLSQAWVKGQKIELSKNESDMFYPVSIRNLDNGECVNARKR